MTSKRPRITVIGSFAVGLTLRVPRFPVKGETLIGNDFDMGPGGKGSNQAVGAARLGAKSYFVGLLGTDMFGDIGVDLYKREGVSTRYLRRTAQRHTGVGFITLDADGNNHIVLDPGANALFTPQDVDAIEEVIANSDAVVSVFEIPAETAYRAMQLARKHNVMAILNPAPARLLDASFHGSIDVLTPNESELRILLGLPPDAPAQTPQLARQLQAQGIRNVVVTCGSKGALILYEDGSIEQVPGVTVDVVDTTGAGDAFTCALTVSLAEGKSLAEAVQFAVYAGAFTCTRLGVIPALPSREEVEALISLSNEER